MYSLKIVDRIEHWPLTRLVRYARNPRTHSPQQIHQLVASMRRFGIVNPALVDKQGNLIAGHGRILAAEQMGLTEFPVIVLDHLTEAQADALRVADNKIAENAGWDEELLAAALAAALEDEPDPISLGFSELELKKVLANLENEVDEDATPEPPQQVVTRRGDLWILDHHRLLCGDATSPEDLNRVMENLSADMIFVDFPYNVRYAAGTSRAILNDDLGEDFSKFLYRSCVAMLAVSGGAIYICMSSSELHTLYNAFTNAGGHWSTFIIWAKNTFTLGRSDFQKQFEPMLYGWKAGGTHFFCGARNLGDVWFIDKPQVNDLHPTMKPLELTERAILYSSRRDNLVLDPCAGSGSTLITCQKTGRRARLMELDPRYVDVTILRWEAYTKKKARLESTGQSFADVAQERQP
jgi:DNA modification methylase